MSNSVCCRRENGGSSRKKKSGICKTAPGPHRNRKGRIRILTVLPLKERDELERLYRSHKLDPDGNSAAVVARQGEEMLGYCLFYIAPERILVEILEPQSDLYLADGILRSALHVAVTRGIHNAFYAEIAEFY